MIKNLKDIENLITRLDKDEKTYTRSQVEGKIKHFSSSWVGYVNNDKILGLLLFVGSKIELRLFYKSVNGKEYKFYGYELSHRKTSLNYIVNPAKKLKEDLAILKTQLTNSLLEDVRNYPSDLDVVREIEKYVKGSK